MSLSPNSALVQRTIDMQYANKKRSDSLKWIFVNLFFLLLFVYDLWRKCPGYTTGAHYAQLAAAGALLAGALHHARRLLPARAAPLRLSRRQLRLLGLSAADLDSSFVLAEDIVKTGDDSIVTSAISDAELSLSLPAAWRSPSGASSHSPQSSHSPHSPPSPPSPHSPHSPHSPGSPPRGSPPPAAPRSEPATRDRFFSDRRSLADYLKQYEQRACGGEAARAEGRGWAPGLTPALAPALAPPPAYQLSALDTESNKLDETSPQGSPQVWWRLHLDPQRLTEWNLNLRLWIHVTILERLVRELREAREGRGAAAWGAGGAGAGAGGRRAALQPYLEPFADQRYVTQRIIELAQGGCLSNYKWNGGGSDWDESKPTDAEIVLHLLATYLDGQMPMAGNPRPFSSQYLSAAPAPPPRGPRALGLHRVALRPPHFALVLGGDTLELARGRNNLLHALLLLLAAAARRRPPALARTHLGPAGLNMLWIIGR